MLNMRPRDAETQWSVGSSYFPSNSNFHESNKREIQKFSNLHIRPDFPWRDFIIRAEVIEVSGYW